MTLGSGTLDCATIGSVPVIRHRPMHLLDANQ